jgi:hypothetical protein
MACLASTPALAPTRVASRATSRSSTRVCRRGGLVVVAGKKGAWAKEFDPNYEKENTVVVVDDSKYPGLESACLSFPPQSSTSTHASSRYSPPLSI